MANHYYPNPGVYLPLLTQNGEYVYGDELGNYYSVPMGYDAPEEWYQVCMSPEDIKVVTNGVSGYFEGFGIPIVEAFKCDTPVITSNVTSMPEVAANAALLIDPFNEQSIAEAMEKILDEDVRHDLIEKGRIRRQDFSWDKAAEGWWNSIINLLN